MVENWTFDKVDELTAETLQELIPDAIFDAHAHIYKVTDLNTNQASIWTEGPQEVSINVWNEYTGRQVGRQRLCGGLFFPSPGAFCDMDKENDYLVEQLKLSKDSRGLILISPAYPEEKVYRYLANHQILGFKPYHVFSSEKPTFQSSIPGYLPEWIWQISDRHGLVIMLHIVRDRALADPANLKDIGELCGRYPKVKLILAHAGRGFHSPNTLKGLPELRGLENIWFDTSGICESAPLNAILKEFGPRRLLWGSDFPISQLRGRCVTVGDGFVWFDRDSVNWEKLSPLCKPVLSGLESLNALMEALNDHGLSRQDFKDIFYYNALRLLGLKL